MLYAHKVYTTLFYIKLKLWFSITGHILNTYSAVLLTRIQWLSFLYIYLNSHNFSFITNQSAFSNLLDILPICSKAWEREEIEISVLFHKKRTPFVCTCIHCTKALGQGRCRCGMRGYAWATLTANCKPCICACPWSKKRHPCPARDRNLPGSPPPSFSSSSSLPRWIIARGGGGAWFEANLP